MESIRDENASCNFKMSSKLSDKSMHVMVYINFSRKISVDQLLNDTKNCENLLRQNLIKFESKILFCLIGTHFHCFKCNYSHPGHGLLRRNAAWEMAGVRGVKARELRFGTQTSHVTKLRNFEILLGDE